MQRARIAAPRDARVVTDLIELVGGDADPHRVFELDEHLGRGAARRPHAIGKLVGRDCGHERRRVGRVREDVGSQEERDGRARGVRAAVGTRRGPFGRGADAVRRRASFSFSRRLLTT